MVPDVVHQATRTACSQTADVIVCGHPPDVSPRQTSLIDAIAEHEEPVTPKEAGRPSDTFEQ